jgi:hypothetical protein
MFHDNISAPSSKVKKSKKGPRTDVLTLEHGTDTLSQIVGKGLLFDTA